MLVSVIVPMYNCQHTIAETLASIMEQTYSNFEVMLVDDGSSDATPDIARTFAERYPNVHYHYKENGGVGHARNFGIRKSKGEFIAFCDSDDLWHESKLEKQVPLFTSGAVGLVYTGRLCMEQGRVWQPSPMDAYPQGDCYYKLLASNFIPASSVVVRRSALETCGMFSERWEMHGSEDRHMWLRIAKRYDIGVVPEPLITYRYTGDNMSLREAAMLKSTLSCLDDILRRFPETGARGKQLVDTIYFDTYAHYGQNLFHQDFFSDARQCFLTALRYKPIHPLVWVFYLATFLPLPAVELARSFNKPICALRRGREQQPVN